MTEPSHDPNALFDALAARLGGGPAQWRLVVTVGQPQDPTNDATIPWPAEREHVDVGTLTVQALERRGRAIAATSTSTRWSCLPALSRRTIRFCRRAPRLTPYPSPAGPASRRRRARFSLGKAPEDAEHLLRSFQGSALVDGGPDPGHALHRRRHGVLAVGLSLARFDPSAARHPDPVACGDPHGESSAEPGAAPAPGHAADAALCRARPRIGCCTA